MLRQDGMGQSSQHIDERIATLDLSLFDAISSQSVKGDRLAWLKLQGAVRQHFGNYTYLEIGSHLGGSIQNHLLDPRCQRIISIDKRPPRQPDDRGQFYEYENNSTERMLDNLRAISEPDLQKIHCIDSDASKVDLNELDSRPHLTFIDGEHTQAAVRSDFSFCVQASRPDGIIALHDDNVIWPAIQILAEQLTAEGKFFRSIKLGGSTFAFFLGDSAKKIHPTLVSEETDGTVFLARERSKLRFEKWVRKPARSLVPAGIRKSIKPWFRSLIK